MTFWLAFCVISVCGMLTGVVIKSIETRSQRPAQDRTAELQARIDKLQAEVDVLRDRIGAQDTDIRVLQESTTFYDRLVEDRGATS